MSDPIAIGWIGPTNDHWEWILGHFSGVTLLNETNVQDWLLLRSQKALLDKSSPQSVLMVAVETRFDAAIDFAKELEATCALEANKKQTAPWCVLLGGDWVGHRRTYPLPETLSTFYWYELYDRVLPWIANISHGSDGAEQAVAQNAQKMAGQRRVGLRVQRLIDSGLAVESRLQNRSSSAQSIELALIIAETATARQFWFDALTRHKIQCVATTPMHLELWTMPKLIVIDIESRPLAIYECQQAEKDVGRKAQLIRKVSNQFPMATIVVTDAFPRWENWKALRQSGADVIVAKPFELSGILDTLINC